MRATCRVPELKGMNAVEVNRVMVDVAFTRLTFKAGCSLAR